MKVGLAEMLRVVAVAKEHKDLCIEWDAHLETILWMTARRACGPFADLKSG
jgi:hypothetical protein